MAKRLEVDLAPPWKGAQAFALARSPISATAELLLNLTAKTALKLVDFYEVADKNKFARFYGPLCISQIADVCSEMIRCVYTQYYTLQTVVDIHIWCPRTEKMLGPSM